MKTITFYEVRGLNTAERMEKNAFETVESAREFANTSKTLMSCNLYEVTMTFNDTVTTTEKHVIGLRTVAHDTYMGYEKEKIADWEKEIQAVKNNKRMKVENKEKRIAEIERYIAKSQAYIQKYYDTYK